MVVGCMQVPLSSAVCAGAGVVLLCAVEERQLLQRAAPAAWWSGGTAGSRGVWQQLCVSRGQQGQPTQHITGVYEQCNIQVQVFLVPFLVGFCRASSPWLLVRFL